MKPWEIAEHVTAALDQELILKEITPDDHFWVGASFAVDPFVGAICKLPLADPPRHERGISPLMFSRVVEAIISGELRGNRLVTTIELVSKACTEDEWKRWYRPILEGKLDLKLSLPLFNKYAPQPIAPPALSKPKTLTPNMAAGNSKGGNFFLQPLYENRCFWLLDSRTDLIEVRGYDESVTRIHDPQIEKTLTELGRERPCDVVIFGYLSGHLLVDDLVTREQFTRESSVYPLEKRLEAANRLGLALVQRSDIMVEKTEMFDKELALIFEQNFKTALLRDLNAVYPFHTQPDFKLNAKSWAHGTFASPEARAKKK